MQNQLTEEVFADGSSYFTAILSNISQAKYTIDLETYIFSSDTLGSLMADALSKAALRGVKVRVLVDGAGTPIWGGKLTRRLEKAGVETRIFHPFPWRLWHWSRSFVRLPKILKAIYLLLKINSRNHRKVIIIDNKIVYVGSFNISKCHLSKDQGGDYWRDTGVCIINADISDLNQAFEAAWHHIPVQDRLRAIFKYINKNPTFRLNNTRHRRRILYKNLLKRIENARKRIWITNAYFVPDNFLLKKLREAAELGVDVRILLPHKSDIFVMPWASTAFYFKLLKAGVRIFEYTKSILHAKTLIIDDWMTVGSSNLNQRSLLHDLEVDVNISDPESRKIIEDQFLIDLQTTNEISLPHWQQRPFYQRFLGWLTLYMKYWI